MTYLLRLSVAEIPQQGFSQRLHVKVDQLVTSDFFLVFNYVFYAVASCVIRIKKQPFNREMHISVNAITMLLFACRLLLADKNETIAV